MKGYIYNTEEKAMVARKLLADYKGLPINKSDITQYWVDYFFSENDNLYYIKYIDGLEIILGSPINLEITEKVI